MNVLNRNTFKGKTLKAFSLTELLVVLVIIGILVLVAMPNLMPLISRAKAYTGWCGVGAMSNMAGFWGTVGKIAKYGAIGIEGLHVTSTVVGAAGGLINKGWKGLGNSTDWTWLRLHSIPKCFRLINR